MIQVAEPTGKKIKTHESLGADVSILLEFNSELKL